MRERRLRLSGTAKRFGVLIPIISTNFKAEPQSGSGLKFVEADGCENLCEPSRSEQRRADGSER